MYNLFAILIVLTCLLLILVIMVQNPKGGGLSSTFGGGNQVMGVKKTTDFLEKSTWVLSIALVVLCLLSTTVLPKGSVQSSDSIKERYEPTDDSPQFENLDDIDDTAPDPTTPDAAIPGSER